MYANRRERLLDNLPNYSIALLYSGKAPQSLGDENYPFMVKRSFYYFTGIDQENEVLMLVKLPNASKEILFIEHYDPLQAKWVGAKILAEEAKEISGINDIKYVEEIKETIGSFLLSYGKIAQFTFWIDLSNEYIGQDNYTTELVNDIKKSQPDINISNIYEKVARMRLSKDEHEIALTRKAIEVTNKGILAMMQACRPLVWENEMEAYFDFVLKSEQCEHSFDTICAAGKNATILHYHSNNQQSKEDDLLLCDLGAEYQKYKADVTRTFPVSGKFTPRQKQIYEIVLRGNKLIASLAKPGVTTVWLNKQLIEFYQEELAKIGLLENGKTVRDYYWHGVSHQLGLETHDVSLPNESLVEGCIISDEPGLYLEDEGIGIRIEDDLLITKKGCEVLTKDIIKEIDDIELFMARR